MLISVSPKRQLAGHSLVHAAKAVTPHVFAAAFLPSTAWAVQPSIRCCRAAAADGASTPNKQAPAAAAGQQQAGIRLRAWVSARHWQQRQQQQRCGRAFRAEFAAGSTPWCAADWRCGCRGTALSAREPAATKGRPDFAGVSCRGPAARWAGSTAGAAAEPGADSCCSSGCQPADDAEGHRRHPESWCSSCCRTVAELMRWGWVVLLDAGGSAWHLLGRVTLTAALSVCSLCNTEMGRGSWLQVKQVKSLNRPGSKACHQLQHAGCPAS